MQLKNIGIWAWLEKKAQKKAAYTRPAGEIYNQKRERLELAKKRAHSKGLLRQLLEHVIYLCPATAVASSNHQSSMQMMLESTIYLSTAPKHVSMMMPVMR